MSKEKLYYAGIKTGISSVGKIPGIGPAIEYLLEDYFSRQLSKLEETRVGEAARYCITKIEGKVAAGASLRKDDRFFAFNENYRSPATEIFEGILTKCKNEHEQKKSKYICNIFVNVAFGTMSAEQVHYILKLAGTMTYRQLCLLKLICENKRNKYNLREHEVNDIHNAETYSLLHEIYDLTQIRLVDKLMIEEETGLTWEDDNQNKQTAYNVVFSLEELIPGRVVPISLGKTMYELLGLEEIQQYELEDIITKLKF